MLWLCEADDENDFMFCFDDDDELFNDPFPLVPVVFYVCSSSKSYIKTVKNSCEKMILLKNDFRSSYFIIV